MLSGSIQRSGFDAGFDADTVLDHEQAPDRYLLQFWPAPPAVDAVLRDGSGNATRADVGDRRRDLPIADWIAAAEADLVAQHAELDAVLEQISRQITAVPPAADPPPPTTMSWKPPAKAEGSTELRSVVSNTFIRRPPP